MGEEMERKEIFELIGRIEKIRNEAELLESSLKRLVE